MRHVHGGLEAQRIRTPQCEVVGRFCSGGLSRRAESENAGTTAEQQHHSQHRHDESDGGRDS